MTTNQYDIDVCYQRWNVMHQPWVALVFNGRREVIARAFGDSEEQAVRAAIAEAEGC